MIADKAFVVPGAGGGVGRHLAPALIERGCSLVLVGRDAAKLDALVAAMDTHERVQTVVGDILDPETGARAARCATDRFGRLDGLIHLVGDFHAGTPAAATPLAVYEQQFAANFLSAAVVTPPVLAQLKEGGVLLYLSSLLAAEPRPTTGAYAASKAALSAWVRTLQQEIAPRRVRANVLTTTKVDAGSANGQPAGGRVPVESIIEALVFLASDAARDIYGATLPVFGSQPPGPSGPPDGDAQALAAGAGVRQTA